MMKTDRPSFGGLSVRAMQTYHTQGPVPVYHILVNDMHMLQTKVPFFVYAYKVSSKWVVCIDIDERMVYNRIDKE